jgi:phosphoglycerate kinase
MCFTLLKARGVKVGESMVEDDQLEAVEGILEGPDGHKIVLPEDLVMADEFAEDASHSVTSVNEIPNGTRGLDIGPKTSAHFASIVEGAASVFWNGPMGVFEWEAFRAGTAAVAESLSRCSGFTAVGGGDSAAALAMLGLEDKVSHLSTGGGAGLELLEGKVLPGVEVLKRWARG